MTAASSAMMMIGTRVTTNVTSTSRTVALKRAATSSLTTQNAADRERDRAALRAQPAGRDEDHPQQHERRPRRHVPAQRRRRTRCRCGARSSARTRPTGASASSGPAISASSRLASSEQRAVRAVREVRVPAEEARASAPAHADRDDGRPAGGLDELVSAGNARRFPQTRDSRACVLARPTTGLPA